MRGRPTRGAFPDPGKNPDPLGNLGAHSLQSILTGAPCPPHETPMAAFHPKALLALLTLAGPGSSLAAQGAAMTSPAGYLTSEGTGTASLFGSFARHEGRVMALDGELRGRAAALRSVAFRADGGLYLASGRSFADVQLRLAPCDVQQRSSTFSLNPSSTPTLVFSGSLTWPDLPANPNLPKPRAWGGSNGGLSLQFTRAWVHHGSQDLCADYVFRGATGHGHYPLDGHLSSLDNYRAPEQLGLGAHLSGCIDSSSYRGFGAFAQLSSYYYGPTYAQPQLRNQQHINLSVRNIAPGAPVLLCLGVAGSKLGWPLPGITCNRLHVDLGQTHLFFVRKADTALTPTIDAQLWAAPAQLSLVGASAVIQGAWQESRSGRWMLTQASRNAILGPSGVVARYAIRSDILGAPQGRPPTDSEYWNPIVRYGL